MIKERAKELKLDAPAAFWITDNATLSMITGGCGPGWLGNLGWFDRAFSVNIKPACRIHDFEYSVGKTLKAKMASDFRLLKNSLKIINSRDLGLMKRAAAQAQAMSYYLFVANFGGRSFRKATII